MGAIGWRDAVAHKILKVQEDLPDLARRELRSSWSPKGADNPKRNHAEPAGVKDEDTFRRLVEQLNAGVYIVAADGILTYVNPRFARKFGYEPDEVIGRSILRIRCRIRSARLRTNASYRRCSGKRRLLGIVRC